MADGFEFVIDKEQPMPTREEVIESEKRLLRWALNDFRYAWDSEVGETVFLSREESEAALKGENNNA